LSARTGNAGVDYKVVDHSIDARDWAERILARFEHGKRDWCRKTTCADEFLHDKQIKFLRFLRISQSFCHCFKIFNQTLEILLASTLQAK